MADHDTAFDDGYGFALRHVLAALTDPKSVATVKVMVEEGAPDVHVHEPDPVPPRPGEFTPEEWQRAYALVDGIGCCSCEHITCEHSVARIARALKG